MIRLVKGIKFKNAVMNEFCTEKRIYRQMFDPYNSASNGVVERKYQTLVEAARKMLNKFPYFTSVFEALFIHLPIN